MSHSIILGTHNRKKGRELELLLKPFGLRLQTLADVDAPLEVDETGDSFAENAALKACEQARHLGAWVLGEDSGICVDALEGAPGVYSARFSGENATDESNNQKLLADLGQTPLERRGAHYVCHIVLSDPQGNVRAESQGKCQGRIQFEPAGEAGFGYDPLFQVREYHRTFGQLGDAVKSALSHRSRAIASLLPQIRQLIGQGAW